MRYRAACRQMAPLLAVFFASIFSVGCTSDDEPVAIRVCGDVQVPQQIDALRVVVLDESGTEIRSGVRSLLECPEDVVRPLPQRFEFQTTPDRGIVVAEGLSDEVVIARARVRANFNAGDTIDIAVNASCIGAQCPSDKTCIDGMCEFIPSADSDLLGCGSAAPSTDTGTDAADTEPNDTGAGDVGDADDAGARFCPSTDGGQAN